MKRTGTLKTATVFFLILTVLMCLCSCDFKKEDAATTVADTAAATVPAVETTDESTTSQPTETTTHSAQTTKPAVTEVQTEAVTEAPTQVPGENGIETVTDGKKTIVYPLALKSSSKTYPVIAWANGTGCPTQLYIKLIEAIANGGYIVIADATVMSGDGTAQIDSINYMLNKNGDSSSVFFNKVDTYAIGVCGQSQGGRSCINAAQKDSRIRCVVSIAGASSADESRGLATPCFFITGTRDRIVESSQWCKPSYDAVKGRAAYASLIGGDHLSFMNNTEEIAEYTLDWFDAYLKNDYNAIAVFSDGGKLATDGDWQDFQHKN